ncbi:MAG TPA: hypothetical protein DDW49_05025 [Deltaproteobacteria bacterium]|nr:MAG: hypothetical protein A2048_00060 [Deltaproteobacteria bacterium GWA2_45_12]HBF12738.1 hypothetical protein [Deltaproteobacteria bacterium]
MKFKDLSPEAVAELLNFLADHEEFESLKNLKGIFTREEVAGILKEVSVQIRTQASEEEPVQKPDYSEQSLSPKAMSLISSLSPREEMLLFKSFKLI